MCYQKSALSDFFVTCVLLGMLEVTRMVVMPVPEKCSDFSRTKQNLLFFDWCISKSGSYMPSVANMTLKQVGAGAIRIITESEERWFNALRLSESISLRRCMRLWIYLFLSLNYSANSNSNRLTRPTFPYRQNNCFYNFWAANKSTESFPVLLPHHSKWKRMVFCQFASRAKWPSSFGSNKCLIYSHFSWCGFSLLPRCVCS